MTRAETVAAYLDDLLRTRDIQDYSGAVNGLQITRDDPVTKIAAAVDFSSRAIDACVEADANLLIVHHGMFWSGTTSFVGTAYQRIKRLIDHGIAVYSSHLPLDMHPELGNNVLLAKRLGLDPSSGFAHSKGVAIGVAGKCETPTSEIIARVKTFSNEYGGSALATPIEEGRKTQRWGLCTGAAAGAETLAEARQSGIDTLIVGEGPHWTAVAAEEEGICVIYAGHYATETLGVQALAQRVSEQFRIPWFFIHAPTGL